jgi:hypothetical protein
MMIRVATLLLCFALAGCLTNEPTPAAQQPAQPTAAAPAAAPDKPAPGQRRGAPAATRGANAPPAPPQQAQDQPPVDPVLEVRQTCWAQGNANKSFKNIEARADWVNNCIAEKNKALR